VTVPASVTTIGYGAFKGCTGLVLIDLKDDPSSLTTIKYSAFEGCTGLKTITIPSTVTNIGDRAFYSCSSLTTFYIPASVTSMGNGIFFGCKNLTSVYSLLTTPSNTIGINKATCTLFVPMGYKNTVYNSWLWQEYKIIEMDLILSINKVDMPKQGGSVTVNVTSINEWMQSCDAEWLTLTKENGSLVLKASTNSTLAERTATVKVSSEGADDQLITVTQEAGTTGIEERLASAFSIFPNPVTSTLHIKGDTEFTTVSIFDLGGRRVIYQRLQGNQVDVSRLANGIYTIQLEGKNGISKSKFVKQ